MTKQWVTFTAAAVLATTAWPGLAAVTLRITDDPAFVNDQLGTTLNGTSQVNGKQHFPTSGDPTQNFDVSEAPNLSAADGILGDWLTLPPDLSAPGWSFKTNPPSSWPVNRELALIYTFNATAAKDVVIKAGVDNGLYLWFDGVFIGGAMRPGVSTLGEHTFSIGDVTDGIHYVQFVLEDHGSTNDFDLLIEAASANPVVVSGDTDGDFDVDDFDLLNAISNFTGSLDPGVGGKGIPEGDTDADMDVDDFDLLTMISGFTGSLPATNANVPEPMSLVTLVAGGLMLIRRRC